MMTHSLNHSCPVLADQSGEVVTLAHGEGGRLSRRLIHERLLPRFRNSQLAALDDAAVLGECPGRLAFSTDSFVVSPLFFPGGNIGSLSVIGTVNDLAVMGARPMWLSLSLIIEEGLPFHVLDQVLDSVSQSASEVGVQVVTGDTKVVPRGAADGLFINTSGIGLVGDWSPLGAASLAPGDQLIVTGQIGRHGVAVMAARESWALEPLPISDCASLLPAVIALQRSSIPIKAMRDATRGGVAAVLHEWSAACGCALLIDESRLPISHEVRGLCELLGLDPLFVANEGTMLIAVQAEFVPAALEALRATQVAAGATCIGQVQPSCIVPVAVRRALGREIPLDEPAGALLPRIC